MNTNRANLIRFLQYVKPYTFMVVLATVGGIVKFTIPLLVPQATRHLLDSVYLNPALTTPAKVREMLILIGGLVVLFILLYAPFTYLRSYMAGKAGHRSVFNLRCDLYYKVLRMSASFFDRKRSGEIVARLISDIELAQNLVGTALTNVWMDIAAVVVVLVFMLRMDPLVTLVALSTLPFYVYIFKRLGGEIQTSSVKVQEEIAAMSSNVSEKVLGSTVIHAFAQETQEGKRFQSDSERLFSTAMRRIRYQSLNQTASGVLTEVSPLIVTLFAGYRVISGSMTVGELIAFTMYLSPLYLPLRRFSELNVVFANSMAALERIFEIMDMKPDIKDTPGAVSLDKAEGRVVFHDVCFSYEDQRPVLDHVSFTAEPGMRVALVGPSGSGKSTAVSLIPRFYDVTSGKVTIDGLDVRSLKVTSLRRHIAMVLQDPVLFSGTIKENILYGKPDATKEEVRRACEAANAYEFTAALPDRFRTEVGERGHFLSGGQKQRITIARAFLKNPRILILDEVTSALDAESESLIQDALERLMRDRTTFIIAHRLSTVVSADKIVVLDAGRIVECGTHTDLSQAGGRYQDLYEKQFSSVVPST